MADQTNVERLQQENLLSKSRNPDDPYHLTDADKELINRMSPAEIDALIEIMGKFGRTRMKFNPRPPGFV